MFLWNVLLNDYRNVVRNNYVNATVNDQIDVLLNVCYNTSDKDQTNTILYY
jgi:hypothetical protein